MGKCIFNAKWTLMYKWVAKAEDKHKAYCTSCNKLIDLGKMGEGALKSHEKGDKHLYSTLILLLMGPKFACFDPIKALKKL